MNNPLVDLILCFTFYSWLGWLLESGYKTARDRRPVNSGFLSGPFVPIYGFGAIGVIQLLNILDPLVSSLNPAWEIVIELGATIVLASLLEFGTGVLLEALFHKRWWDYSDERFNLLGLVSLKYSMLWGGLSLIALNIIQPRLETVLYSIPMHVKITALTLLMAYLVLDLVHRCIYHAKANRGNPGLNWRKKMNPNWKFFRRLTDEEQYRLYMEYAACVDELVFHPKVQMMKQFRHHQNASCFEHSLNVSFASYLLCKKLGWDCKSAARGGLLHDLFLYDWRTTDLAEGKHGFVHPRIAYDNAAGEFTLNPKEKDIILKHMFPLTWRPPSCKESLLVCAVDKLCALQELLGLSTAADVSMGFEGL